MGQPASVAEAAEGYEEAVAWMIVGEVSIGERDEGMRFGVYKARRAVSVKMYDGWVKILGRIRRWWNSGR